MPRQHGAWATLAMPLAVGALAAGPAWVDLPLTAFWLAGYLAFNARGLWLRSGRRRRYLPTVHAYAVLTIRAAVLPAQPLCEGRRPRRDRGERGRVATTLLVS